MIISEGDRARGENAREAKGFKGRADEEGRGNKGPQRVPCRPVQKEKKIRADGGERKSLPGQLHAQKTRQSCGGGFGRSAVQKRALGRGRAPSPHPEPFPC